MLFCNVCSSGALCLLTRNSMHVGDRVVCTLEWNKRHKWKNEWRMHQQEVVGQGKKHHHRKAQHMFVIGKSVCNNICKHQCVYLLLWGPAYLRRRRRVMGEGCGSLVTPGGDSRGSPHLKHTETHGTHQWWPGMEREGGGHHNAHTLHQSQGSNYRNTTPPQHPPHNKNIIH